MIDIERLSNKAHEFYFNSEGSAEDLKAVIELHAKVAIAEQLQEQSKQLKRIANVLEMAQAPQFDGAIKTVGYND